MRVYVCAYVHVCVCVCMRVHACACVCMRVHACACVGMRVYVCACVRMRARHLRVLCARCFCANNRYSACLFGVVATLAVITYATPIFLLAIVPALWFYTATQDFFIATSREIMCASLLLLLLSRTITKTGGARIIKKSFEWDDDCCLSFLF